MSKLLIPFLLVVVLLGACSSQAATQEPGDPEAKPVVSVFRPPT